jgi:type IV fimbrial biogenesis protein FimT
MIELMIAITIFAIVLAMGVPSYRDWIQSSQIRTAAESILNGLTLARSEAVKLNQTVTFTFTSIPNSSWTITDAGGTVLQQRDFSEGSANAVVAANPAAITFNALGRITPAGAAVINVTNPTGGACAGAGGPMRCLDIMINSGAAGGGQIRMCDPAVPIATSPRGC